MTAGQVMKAILTPSDQGTYKAILLLLLLYITFILVTYCFYFSNILFYSYVMYIKGLALIAISLLLTIFDKFETCQFTSISTWQVNM
jgi:cytochrome c biogenesis protein CcdA